MEINGVSDPYAKKKQLENFYKEEGLGFNANFSESFQDDAKKFLETQQRQASDLERQLGYATEQAKKSLGQDLGALNSKFSRGREGFNSSSNSMISKELIGGRKEEFNQQMADIESKKLQLKQLQEAQQRGYLESRADQIAALGANLAKAEKELQDSANESRSQTMDLLTQLNDSGALAGLSDGDMAYLEQMLPDAPGGVIQLLSGAATRKQASEEKAAILDNQKNTIDMVSGLVKQGVTMTPEMMMNFAQQSGLPMESLYSFNTQAQQVMNDKSLDQATKAAELQKLTNELDREGRGIVNADLERLDYIEGLYQQGASQEEISRAKKALGMDDEDDPMYQAELMLKRSEAEIKRKQAAGLPVTMDDKLKQLEAKEKIAAMNGYAEYGIGDAYVPNQSLNGITATFEDGKLKIACDDPMQCGEFVNRTWGLGSGGSGGFGDSKEQKMKLVESRGISTGSIVDFASQIKPGMAFVTDQGANGHVGIVTQVFPDGTYTTYEANIGDNNPATPDPPQENSRSIKDGDLQGFVYPPKGKFEEVGKTGGDTLYSQFEKMARDAGLTSPTEIKKFADQRLADSFKPPTEAQGKALKALYTATNESENYQEAMKGVDPVDLSNSVGVIARELGNSEEKLTSQLVNQYVDDPKVRNLINSELRWVAAVLREESGAAISASEYLTKGSQFFPRKGDDASEIERKRRAREVEERGLKAKIGAAGDRAFQEELKIREEAKKNAPKQENPFVNFLSSFIGQPEISDDQDEFSAIDMTTPEGLLSEFDL
jgi:hypothetical protein